MANIYEVAELAGVSLATVSRVINPGAKVSDKTRQRVLEAMRELGYDMQRHTSKGLDAVPPEFDYAVTMGCGDSCPTLKAKKRIDWQIPDPKHLSPDEYREVRNLIGRMVKALLDEATAS